LVPKERIQILTLCHSRVIARQWKQTQNLTLKRLVSLSTGALLSALMVSPVLAQKVSKDNVRAINTARTRAESINGGLNNYRAAKCMYATGKGGAECLKSDSDGFLFVFDGGSPGWQEAGGPSTVETEILVSKDGISVVDVIYNGAPR
jgi:hypothetical protein